MTSQTTAERRQARVAERQTWIPVSVMIPCTLSQVIREAKAAGSVASCGEVFRQAVDAYLALEPLERQAAWGQYLGPVGVVPAGEQALQTSYGGGGALIAKPAWTALRLAARSEGRSLRAVVWCALHTYLTKEKLR